MVTDLGFAAVLFHALYLFGIGSAVAESPIDRDQLSVRDRDDRTLTPRAGASLVGIGTGTGISCLRLQPIPFVSRLLATIGCPVVFVRFFVCRRSHCCRADRRPRCEMMTTGKRSVWAQIHSCFGRMLAAAVGLIPGTVQANFTCCGYGFNRTAISLSSSSIISSMVRMWRRD